LTARFPYGTATTIVRLVAPDFLKLIPGVRHLPFMSSLVLSAGFLMFCAPVLWAGLWDWSYTGNQWAGSGQLTTDSGLTTTTGIFGFTGYRILDITGTFNSLPITGLLPPLNFLSNDNLLSLTTPQLSVNGLAFTNSDNLYNISYSGSLNNYTATSANPFFSDNGRGTFIATPEVPEPASAMLIVPALLVSALLIRHRKCDHIET
jgi:hypothetical protein